MTKLRFSDILEDCLHRLDRGEFLQEILEIYPAQAERLQRLLGIAMVSRALPRPIPEIEVIQSGKNNMLGVMDQLQETKAFIRGLENPSFTQKITTGIRKVKAFLKSLYAARTKPAYRLVTAFLVVVIGSGLFRLSASAAGLPGGVFYYLQLGFKQILPIFPGEKEDPQELEYISTVEFTDYILGGGSPTHIKVMPELDDQDDDGEFEDDFIFDNWVERSNQEGDEDDQGDGEDPGEGGGNQGSDGSSSGGGDGGDDDQGDDNDDQGDDDDNQGDDGDDQGGDGDDQGDDDDDDDGDGNNGGNDGDDDDNDQGDDGDDQ